MLLGAARYLSEHRDFAGTVRFIFQPAEEGDGGGAAMVADGLFERFPVDSVHGMHTGPGVSRRGVRNPQGRLSRRHRDVGRGFPRHRRPWRRRAASGDRRCRFPPHSSSPLCRPSSAAISRRAKLRWSASAISAAATITRRTSSRRRMTVRGTSRCFSREVDALIEKRLGELAKNAAEAYGCRAEFDFHRITPALFNDPATNRCRDRRGAQAGWRSAQSSRTRRR